MLLRMSCVIANTSTHLLNILITNGVTDHATERN